MQIIKIYFKLHYLKWEELIGFCTDGAPVNLRFYWGLVTFEKKNLSTLTTHCIIHYCQAIAAKLLLEELAITMGLTVKLINFVQSKALNMRLLKTF